MHVSQSTSFAYRWRPALGELESATVVNDFTRKPGSIPLQGHHHGFAVRVSRNIVNRLLEEQQYVTARFWIHHDFSGVVGCVEVPSNPVTIEHHRRELPYAS